MAASYYAAKIVPTPTNCLIFIGCNFKSRASHADVLRGSSRVRGAGTRDELLEKLSSTYNLGQNKSIKTAYLTYKCVLRLHCVVHGSIMAVLSNPYILNVTQQCRCSPTLILRAWATCGMSITCEIVQVPRSVASRPRAEHCAR